MDEDFEPFLMVARKIFRGDLWLRPRVFSEFEAWLDMVASASYAPETTWVEGRCIKLLAGELVSSVRYLARKWGWSKSKVERFLSFLREGDRIGTRTETGITVITLCKYSFYNRARDGNGTETGHARGHPRDTAGTNINKGEKEMEGNAHDADFPPVDPESRSRWRKSRGYPERHEAVAAATMAGTTPEAAGEWWDNREADDWKVNRLSGHATSVSRNWRADMKRFASRSTRQPSRRDQSPQRQSKFSFSAPVYTADGKMIRDANGTSTP